MQHFDQTEPDMQLTVVHKRQRIPKGQSQMDNPKKQTKQGTQDDKTNKNITKTQYNMCWTPLCTNKHNNVNKT